MASRKPTSLEATPDALGQRGRAQIWVNMLAQAQAQREEVVALQVANEHTDDDLIPGLGPKEDGDGVIYEDGQLQFWTYKERREHFDQTVSRLWKQAHENGLGPAVQELLKSM